MFQKPAFLDWNEKTNDRYMTLGGFPVYTHEEPNYLARAFRRARDFVNLPEVKLPFVFGVVAGGIDYFAGNNSSVELMTILGLTASIWYKGMASLLEMQLQIGPIRRQNGRFGIHKSYYFDTSPEGPRNLDKPTHPYDMSLKARSVFVGALNGAAGTCFTGAAVYGMREEPSLSVIGITTIIAAPAFKTAWRHYKALKGDWDITDQLPPKQKKPEKVPASARSSEVLAYVPA